MVCFSASQTVTIEVPPLSVPIQRYFCQPERLMHALVDPHQVRALGGGSFQLSMRSISFMMLTLQPVADITIWNEQDRILIQSEQCQLAGQDALNKRFSFNLQGFLEPQQGVNRIDLVGQAALQVQVDLPAAFRLSPRALLESTGNGMLNGILVRIKQRLLQRLVEDYAYWATQQSRLSVSNLTASNHQIL
jgi:hypothetical protein